MIDIETVEGVRKKRTILLVLAVVVSVATAVLARHVMLPFVLALVVAYVLAPLVAWMESRRVPRAIAIIVTYVVVLGAIGIFGRMIMPRVAFELVHLRKEAPSLVHKVQTEWLPKLQAKINGIAGEPAPVPEDDPQEKDTAAFVVRPRLDGSFAVEVAAGAVVRQEKGGFVVDTYREDRPHSRLDGSRMLADAVNKSIRFAEGNVGELFRIGRDIVAGVSRVFFVFGLTLMLAAYLLLTRERVVGFLRSCLRPKVRPSFDRLLLRLDKGLSGVVRGQLIICVINGVLSAIGFALVGLKYWPVLALIAAVMSLIPIFGSIASSVPAVAMGLGDSVGTAVFVLVWIIGIHQIEANLLNPKIMGDAAKIHPVLVVFSLLVGEHFFHAIGALLAVPCMSIAQTVFLHLLAELEAKDPEFSDIARISLPPPGPKAGPGVG